MKSDEPFKVDIEKSKNGTRIAIRDILLDSDKRQFDEACKILIGLYRRMTELDETIESKKRVQDANLKVSALWTITDEQIALSDLVLDAEHRIALGVLRHYPECVRITDLAKEVSCPRTTVRNHLRGTVKSVADYYESCSDEDGFRFSPDGIEWVIERVVPLVLTLTSQTELTTNGGNSE